MKVILKYLFVVFMVSFLAESKRLIIHLIPHSHNDAGWLMSFEKYYQKSTKHIISNVVNVLNSQPDKKFHWADFAFFMRWWSDQDNNTKQTVHKLVESNRLIFINGGWVMNDEALPSYKESLMQMRFGLSAMKDLFNVRPTIGWQIDPFGSSAATVANLHKLGYDALVENRISNEFKDKLEKGEGFNFYWEGHQVSKDKSESNLLTHILQFFYIIPNTRLDSQFKSLNMQHYKTTFFSKEIKPVLNELKAMTNNNLDDYHVMVPIGDDFGFQDAEGVFKKFDELIPELNNEGKNFGYETTTKYSSLYEYFDELKKINLTLGQFKGDFLPYQEPFHNWNDFWTGYYSTRLHMKRYIRYIFNDIQATKLLLASRAITANKGSIHFDKNMAKSIDAINDLIDKANSNFLILMHHDGITGTHTSQTETNYYFMLNQALEYTDSAKKAIKKDLSIILKPETILEMKGILAKLREPEIIHLTVVNPTGYIRNEVINITLPDISKTDNFVFVVQDKSESKLHTDVDAFIVDLIDMDNMRRDLGTTRKGFIEIEVPALGEIQIYVVRSTGGQQECKHVGIKCAKWVDQKFINQATTLSNSQTKAHFTQNGEFIKLENLSSKIEEVFEESFTYYDTSKGSRSGIYIFNPRQAQKIWKMTILKMFTYTFPLAQILQIYLNDGHSQFIKTHILPTSGSSALQSQLTTIIQLYSSLKAEMSYTLKKVPNTPNSLFKAYSDDSLKLVQRPIYDRSIGIKATNDIELMGYFTSSWVHGGMLREYYTHEGKEQEVFFGWANSNPVGCTFAGQAEVGLMLFRSIGNNDYKGIDENLSEQHVITTQIQIYVESDVEKAMQAKVVANAAVNEPLTVFEKMLNESDLDHMHYSGSLLEMLFDSLEHPHQLSNRFGEIDVVDLKIVKHNILQNYTDHEIDLVLRNRFGGYVKMHKPPNKNKEGIFKNKYIDIFKKSQAKNLENMMDPKKKILSNDRYELETLENEIQSNIQKEPSNFRGLEPFEMAQFKLVWEGVLKALEIEHKNHYQNTNAG